MNEYPERKYVTVWQEGDKFVLWNYHPSQEEALMDANKMGGVGCSMAEGSNFKMTILTIDEFQKLPGGMGLSRVAFQPYVQTPVKYVFKE